LGRALGGDLGRSYLTGESVAGSVIARLPVTIELMTLAQALALLIAVPTGVLSAWKAGGAFDRVAGATAFGLMALPVFALSLLLIYLFALKLRWLPATGFVPVSAGLGANLESLFLPALSLALVEWVPLMRVLRSDMLAALKEDYILMARAKGLPTRLILFRHAFRPSLFTLITLFGIQIGHLIGGTVIVESIFALPGVGRLLIGAVFSRDVLLVQGCILFITVGYVTVNFLVDLAYTALDPRIRKGPILD
jgi:peptide/nickel transport system permease protein